ncbi:DUF6018 family natural product bioysynthesis protein [Psychrobacillus sp. MER TA 171]|uniref:DUF6018 family natural product bioysynthesis protein n=1 Tax=Psychrobacillus sp. MER TA 171 TaxID=2939577 RepID=UPI00203E8613|nr:DUF6018 family natural product bioysynthesis protein [Psychrobacillus sp. MER TA 171]MCM3358133.1 DUF6018 family natural product bioysynthesis protein [Psychrobacillus sp. MER TA 171]
MSKNIGAVQQISVMERVGREVFNTVPRVDCTYRVEVRTSDGAIRYYGLRTQNKAAARKEAVKIIKQLLTSNDDRILWRMAGERNWSLNVPVNKVSKFKRGLNWFFDLEDVD